MDESLKKTKAELFDVQDQKETLETEIKRAMEAKEEAMRTLGEKENVLEESRAEVQQREAEVDSQLDEARSNLQVANEKVELGKERIKMLEDKLGEQVSKELELLSQATSNSKIIETQSAQLKEYEAKHDRDT